MSPTHDSSRLDLIETSQRNLYFILVFFQVPVSTFILGRYALRQIASQQVPRDVLCLFVSIDIRGDS